MHRRLKTILRSGLGIALLGAAFAPLQAQSDDLADTTNATPTQPQSEIVVSRKREICPSSSKSDRAAPELVLDGRNIVDVEVWGETLRLEVVPGISGPVQLNAEVVKRLGLRGNLDLTWDLGAFDVHTATTWVSVNFGCKTKKKRRVSWTSLAASQKADGVIGAYDLPYDKVTWKLNEPTANDTVEKFPLKRKGGRRITRLGTQIEIGDRTMFAHFSLGIGPNLVSARTANFLATHRDGGFVPDSNRIVKMIFGIPRPTREMRLAYPIEVAGLELETFAVRIEDHGKANKVGEIEKGDPRFEPGHIVVSRRKRKGRPDIVTRIGRDSFDHCSRLTFDLENEVGYLTCPAQQQEPTYTDAE